MKVAVVGAGIHGSSVALSLARRGHDATVFDQYEAGHSNGSSHGRSRIIRKAYPDPFFTAIMDDAYSMWDELQAQCNLRFVNHTGILYFGNGQSSTLREVEDSLTQNHVEFERLFDGESMGLRFEPYDMGLISTDGGWVHADVAVSEIQRLAKSQGVQFLTRKIGPLEEIEPEFDRIILAPGAWITEFVDLEVEVRVQTVAYVRLEWQGPVWIEDGPDFLYGFPTTPGESTVKIGVHTRGHRWNLTDRRPGSDEISVELIRSFVRKRFGIADPKIDEVVTCLYTMTPNEDFRWGWLNSRTAFVSACSGHGFKFGPWMGERLADAIEGKFELSRIPRFHSPSSIRN